MDPAWSCTPEELPAWGIIHCSWATAMGHVPGHEDQAVPTTGGDTTPELAGGIPAATRPGTAPGWGGLAVRTCGTHVCSDWLIYCAAMHRTIQ